VNEVKQLPLEGELPDCSSLQPGVAYAATETDVAGRPWTPETGGECARSTQSNVTVDGVDRIT